MPPSRDVQVPILTSEYAALCDKRDSANVIKDLEIGELSWIVQVDPMESQRSL